MNGSLDLVTGDSIFSGQEQHLVDALQYLLNKKGISKNGGNLPRKINIEALKELNISEDNKLSNIKFMQILKDTLGQSIQPVLDEESHSAGKLTPDDVPLIVDKILSSPHYGAISSQIVEQIRVCGNIIMGMLSKQAHPAAHNVGLGVRRDPSHIKLNLNRFSNTSGISSSTSLGSSKADERRHTYHHDNSVSGLSAMTLESCSLGSIASGLCPGVDELKLVISSLNSSQSLDMRLAAAQKLTNFSVGDLISDEFWPDARLALEHAINDHDTRIALISLRIYARSFRCAPLYIIPDIYVSFVNQLTRLFERVGPTKSNSYNSKIPKWSQGIIVTDEQTQLLLKKFRLLNQFMIELPSMWFRFPEHAFRDMANATFNFLSTKASREIMAPIHFLCLVDPEAKWFEKWMLSQLGKSKVTSAMVRSNVLTDLAQIFVQGAILYSGSSGSASRSGTIVSPGQTSSTYVGSSPHSPRSPMIPYSPAMTGEVIKVHQNDDIIVEDMDQEGDEPEKVLPDNLIPSRDIQYVSFLHVMTILSRLCTFKKGRSSFPLVLSPHFSKRYTAELTNRLPQNTDTGAFEMTTDTYLRLLTQQTCRSRHFLWARNLDLATTNSVASRFELCRFSSQLFRKISSSNACSRNEIFKDDILRILVHPIRLVLQGGTYSEKQETSIFVCISKILSDIASFDSGRKFILRGEHWSRETVRQNDFLDIIAQFVTKGLKGEADFKLPRDVLASYIFFLRQIYRTTEGITDLEKHQLHKALAFGYTELPVSDESQWKKSLTDNLLNFAATPRGVIFLFQTNLLKPCIEFMVKRYVKKLTVSKCEKFGYGTLVSQVSVSTCGLQALNSCGFLETLIISLTEAIEGRSSRTSSKQRPVSSSILENHATKKLISSILKVLCSSYGLEMLIRQESEKVRKSSLTSLLKQLALNANPGFGICSSSHNDAHQIGLQILLSLVSSLDSFLILEENFGIHEPLMRLQQASLSKKGMIYDLMRDHNTLFRNQILVATLTVGGPGERSLPNVDLEGDVPIFMGDKIPSGVIISRPTLKVNPDEELKELLNETVTATNSSQLLQKLLDMHKKNMDTIGIVRNMSSKIISKIWDIFDIGNESDPIRRILEQNGLVPHKSLPLAFDSLIKNGQARTLSKSEKVAISLGSQYAHRILDDKSRTIQDHHSNLQTIVCSIKASDAFHPYFPGHDWFVFTLYIMCDGDLYATMRLLERIAKSALGPYLWSRQEYQYSKGIHLVAQTTSQSIEYILSNELPLIYSAFTLSGCTAAQICERWIRECFWNVLNFPQIQAYISLCHLFGLDYQVYFCLSVLHHAQQDILEACANQSLIIVLTHPSSSFAKNFEATRYFCFMQRLKEKYRSHILPEMLSALSEQ